jgi:hypothetical protein
VGAVADRAGQQLSSNEATTVEPESDCNVTPLALSTEPFFVIAPAGTRPLYDSALDDRGSPTFLTARLARANESGGARETVHQQGPAGDRRDDDDTKWARSDALNRETIRVGSLR